MPVSSFLSPPHFHRRRFDDLTPKNPAVDPPSHMQTDRSVDSGALLQFISSMGAAAISGRALPPSRRRRSAP